MRVTLHVLGIGKLSLNGPQAALERAGLTDGEAVEGAALHASYDGFGVREFVFPLFPAVEGGTRWSAYFEALAGRMVGSNAISLSLSGWLAVAAISGYREIYERERAAAKIGRGRPKRYRHWDADREEIYARILQRRQEHQESLDEAVWSVAKLCPVEFRRAFGGKLTSKRKAAAVQYFKRHARDMRSI